MKSKVLKGLLIFWTLFIGIGALGGGTCMLIAPDGSILHMNEMLPYFQVLPFADVLFQNYIFSGIMLILVNGVSNIVATIFLFQNKKIGYILGTIFGLTLMLWIIIQFIIFPTNLTDILYFTFGALQFLTGYCALVDYCQKYFVFNESDYKNINKGSKTVVIFFSRVGYTRKIAYEKADSLGADIIELRTLEKTDGTLGFWWCGRFGMHKWAMKLQSIKEDLNSYDKIILVTPIWVFNICAPMRAFINDYDAILKTKDIDVVFNRFRRLKYKNAIAEISEHVKSIHSVEYNVTRLGHTTKK